MLTTGGSLDGEVFAGEEFLVVPLEAEDFDSALLLNYLIFLNNQLGRGADCRSRIGKIAHTLFSWISPNSLSFKLSWEPVALLLLVIPSLRVLRGSLRVAQSTLGAALEAVCGILCFAW